MIKNIRSSLSLMDKLLIIFLILSIAVISFATLRKGEVKSVLVNKDGYLVGEYALNVARDIRVDEHNTLRIKDNKISMIYADCPDKRCVKQGASSIMPIICLPNRVHIKIRAYGEQESQLILH